LELSGINFKFPSDNEDTEGNDEFWFGLNDDSGLLLEFGEVGDVTGSSSIDDPIPHLDVLSIDYSSTHTMETAVLDITFSTSEPDDVYDSDLNAYTIHCIAIDMPFYLY
jgi:hypothetical protein